MTSKVSNIIFISIAVVCLIASAVFYYLYNQEQKKTAQLEYQLSAQLPMERIDSHTVRKVAVITDNILNILKFTSKKVLELAKERKQDIRYINTVDIRYRVDTIKITADTVILVAGKEYGVKRINDKLYSVDLQWTCKPYEAIINNITFKDKITLIGYEKDEEVGVYAVNENPYGRMDSVHYFWQKPPVKKWSFGLGIGTNSTINEIRPLIKIGYKPFAIGVSTDIKKLFKDKPKLEDFYFYGIYEF